MSENGDSVEQTEIAPIENITQKQVDLIHKSFNNGIPIRLIGGYADDTLLARAVTREHHDIDMIAMREQSDEIERSYTSLGCQVEKVDQPDGSKVYKFVVKKDGVEANVGIFDKDDQTDRIYLDVNNPQGERFRLFFGKDCFDYPAQSLNGQEVQTVSPQMLIQMRRAVSIMGGFPLREKDKIMQQELINKYFPGLDPSDERFKPEVMRLTSKPAPGT